MKQGLTVSEVAKMCHISDHKIRDAFDEGLLKGHHLRGSTHRRFTRWDVVDFLNNSNVSLDQTYYNNANLLVVVCERPTIVMDLAEALKDEPCRIIQTTHTYDLGCLVQQAEGRFCWAVIDVTLKAIKARHIAEVMARRKWPVVALKKKDTPRVTGALTTFYFPFDSELLATYVRRLINT